MRKFWLAFCLMLMSFSTAWGQYDRAVVALTRLDYVYYNIDNPMSVSVPGLLPKDIRVTIGEDRAFLHRDPDGSNVNDFVVRPKDSTGTITVHVNEVLDEWTAAAPWLLLKVQFSKVSYSTLLTRVSPLKPIRCLISSNLLATTAV